MVMSKTKNRGNYFSIIHLTKQRSNRKFSLRVGGFSCCVVRNVIYAYRRATCKHKYIYRYQIRCAWIQMHCCVFTTIQTATQICVTNRQTHTELRMRHILSPLKLYIFFNSLPFGIFDTHHEKCSNRIFVVPTTASDWWWMEFVDL